MAILGMAIFDAFEAARLSRREGTTVIFAGFCLICLVLSFAACVLSYGLEVAQNEGIPARPPGAFFIFAIVLAMVAKTLATWLDRTPVGSDE